MTPFKLETLRQLARKQRLSLGDAEKDYVLSVGLNVLAGSRAPAVFKGGTSIKKAYFPDFRFSSDLDFTLRGQVGPVREVIKKAFENQQIHGIRFQKVKEIETKKPNAILSLQYQSQVSQADFTDSIRVELSTEQPVELEPEKRRILDPEEYELPETKIDCMQLGEILAEKIHAVYHRRKPRDLYDIAYLLDKGTPLNKRLVAAKLKPLGMELKPKSFQERASLLEETWNDDLKTLMPNVPDFKTEIQKVNDKLFRQA